MSTKRKRYGRRSFLNVLIACEFSGVVREAFNALGHNAWSCDLLDTEQPGQHIKGNVLDVLDDEWDLMIAHPPCTRLANSGVRWLHIPPKGKTLDQMWADFEAGCDFYLALRDAVQIPCRGIENPIIHKYARQRINITNRQIVQPWQFGVPAFKGTGFELINLPELIPTNVLERPTRGTLEYKQWSAVHMASPGPDRWKDRSRTFDGIASAMADQWGEATMRYLSAL